MVKANTRNWRRWAFLLAIVGELQNVVLLAVAMFYYPGGTESNHDTVGYSFCSNWFSDLGRRVALSGDPNTTSRWLFVISGCILGLLLCLFFGALPRLFIRAKSARRLAVVGSLFGVTAGVSTFAISFVPLDLHPVIHNALGATYGVAFFIALALYSVAIFRTDLYPNAYAYVTLAYAIILVAWAAVVVAAPDVETTRDNMLQATTQKIQSYSEAICIPVLAYGALRVEKRLQNLHAELPSPQ